MMKRNDKSGGQKKVALYGFDEVGFSNPVSFLDLGHVSLSFINMGEEIDLGLFDGVVIPGGIFEVWERHRSHFGVDVRVKCREDLLMNFERQLLNILKKEKWVCFLVQEIHDYIPGTGKDISALDLCKRTLNRLEVRRGIISPSATVLATQSEFNKYIEKYGVARTKFAADDQAVQTLAKSEGDIVGIEANNQIFFLPLHAAHKSAEVSAEIGELIASAIADYRQKNSVSRPEWLNDFKFNSEMPLLAEHNKAMERIVKLSQEMQIWEDYKTMLTTSGNFLREMAINVLEKYFGLKIDPLDEGREDGKILKDDGSVYAVFEVKGVKKSVCREHINQVDAHKERGGHPKTMPGILLINNQMDVTGIQERSSLCIASEQIAHARFMNVVVIRTIDLLFFMKHLEQKNIPERKAELLRILDGGGGWLRAIPESYSVLVK